MSHYISPVCRTCLRIISDEQIAYDINSEGGLVQNVQNISEMVTFCVPEMDLLTSPDPLICEECLTGLVNFYNFKIRCMRVENAIQSHIQTNTKLDDKRVNLGDIVRKKIYESLSQNPDFSGRLQEYMDKVNHCLNVPPQVFNKSRLAARNIHKKVFDNVSQNSNFETSGLMNPMEVINANEYARKEAVICSAKNENEKPVNKIEAPVTRRTSKRQLTGDQIKQEILSKRRRLAIDLKPKLAYLHTQKQLVVKLIKHPVLKCTLCDFMTLDEKMLNKHNTESHIFCKMCNFKCNKKIHFKWHLERCHSNETHDLIDKFCSRFNWGTCQICRISGLNKFELSKHQISMHIKKNSNFLYQCPYEGCDVQHPYADIISSHIQSDHERQQIYECPICNFSSSKNNGMKAHVASHGIVTCVACRQSFNSRKLLIKHKETCARNFPIKDAYSGNNLVVVDKEGRIMLKRHENSLEMPSIPELLCAQTLIESHDHTINDSKDDCVLLAPEITTIYLSDDETTRDPVEIIDSGDEAEPHSGSLLKLALTGVRDPLCVETSEDVVMDALNECLNTVFEKVETGSSDAVLSESEHLIFSDNESVSSTVNAEPICESAKVSDEKNTEDLRGLETQEVLSKTETGFDSECAAMDILNHILERVSIETSNKDNITDVIMQSESNSSLIDIDLSEGNDLPSSQLENNEQFMDSEDLFRTIIGV